jgi:hypothetical protein
MTMTESSSSEEIELVLNMSSITAVKSFFGLQDGSKTNLEFNYLKKHNPTLSRLDWQLAQRWISALEGMDISP